MNRSDSQRPVSIALVALPESTPATLYGLYEVFSSVGVTWGEVTGQRANGPRMEARIIAAGREPFTSAIGLPIAPQASFDEVTRADAVIVTDLAISLDIDPRGRWPEAAAWVRARHEAGAMVCSVCTGSLFLAAAGLLDGEEATTHWSAAPLFQRYFPAVKLRPERIILPAGTGHSILTSGGVASWEELALYLIARFCGQMEAVRAAKLFVLGDRSDGQLPYAAMTRLRQHGDAVVATCQEWIADNYAASNPVARMVAHSGLPERTLKRRFKAATGYSPVEYVQALRIEESKQLLETTAEVIDRVAQVVGYEDPTFFRRLFKRRTGVTPARYRQKFRTLVGARTDHLPGLRGG